MDQRPDRLTGPFAVIVDDPLQRHRIVLVEGHLHHETAFMGYLRDLHIRRIDMTQLLIEVPWHAIELGLVHPMTRCVAC
jgi:hypothetical protein